VEAELKRLDRERGAAASRQVVQDLRRALKGLRNRLPQYELPAVASSEAEMRDAGEAGIAPAAPRWTQAMARAKATTRPRRPAIAPWISFRPDLSSP